MRIAVAREVDPGEDRVAATPDTVKKLTGFGAEVAVEPGAGVKSGIPDADFAAAGATVVQLSSIVKVMAIIFRFLVNIFFSIPKISLHHIVAMKRKPSHTSVS